MKILIYILLAVHVVGLDLKFHAKVPIPSNISPKAVEDLRIGSLRNDGAFLVATGYDSDSDRGVGWLIKADGNYIAFLPSSVTSSRTTNIVSISNENGQMVIFLNEIVTRNYTNNSGELLLKTASPNGCLFSDDVTIQTDKITYKLISNKVDSYQQSQSIERFSIISKYNHENKLVEKKIIPALNTLRNPGPGFHTESPNAKHVFAAEIKDGYIYFYRLTDSDLLLSPNRITLGSSQNGSLTATVNNPEQALLNIQSSTNLIDWNTFKTIQNEPSLEVVIPANKPKEFIRAIE
jgi:hypothetical protein